jgi:anti-sigma B factor antagonist
MATPKTPPRSPSVSPPFDLQVSYRLGAPLVYVRGELDHQTATQLRAVIEEESAPAPPAVILDLTGLSYMDSGGLSLLFETLNRLKGKSWLGLVGVTAPVSRLMEITGLVEQPGLRILPDLAAAVEALKGSQPPAAS